MKPEKHKHGTPVNGSRLTFSLAYFLAAVGLFITEVLIAIYAHDRFIRPFLGDFLVVILIYCSLKSVVRIDVLPAAAGVLLFACAIEILQAFHIVDRVGLGGVAVARTVIGTTFQWGDIVAYTLGIGLVILVETTRDRGI